MPGRILLNILIFVLTLSGMAFTLSNVSVKGRPLWCYLNTTIVLKGGQAFQMTKELDQVKTSAGDYMVLGSSHAYRGYDPAYFKTQNIHIFNAGSSSQNLASSFTLLKYYKGKFGHVLLDIYPGSVCKPSGESQFTLLQSTPNSKLAFQLFKIKLNIFSVNNMAYRVFRLNEDPLYEEDGYKERGYLMTEKTLSEDVLSPVCDFDESQYGLLVEIIEYCRRENIDLTLVSHPLPIPTNGITDYYIFKKRLDEICKDHHVPFYDYTYQHHLDHSYFMDHNHLNYKGVEYFNKEFINDKFNKL